MQLSETTLFLKRRGFSLCWRSVKTKSRALRGVTGFVAYTLIRTDDGGVSVTVCQDKTGTDESIKKARDWIQANALHLRTRPPVVMEGSVVLKLG